MARAVFSAKALGLSKVLCSMDTINSYQASRSFGWSPSRVFWGGFHDGFRGVFFFLGKTVGMPDVLENRGGGGKKRWVVSFGFFGHQNPLKGAIE